MASCPPSGLADSPRRESPVPSDQVPRFSRGAPEEPGSFRIVDDFLFGRVPANFAAGAERDVAEVGCGGGLMADLRVGRGPAASADAFGEVPDVQVGRVAANDSFTLHAIALGPFASAEGARPRRPLQLGIDLKINPLFEATEEPIVNAMVAAETMTGRDNHTVIALPRDRLLQVLRK